MKYAIAALLALALSGCSSFLHFSNPDVQLVSCDVSAAVLPILEAEAINLGLPLQVVEMLYTQECGKARDAGKSQADAENYGVTHAFTRARSMK